MHGEGRGGLVGGVVDRGEPEAGAVRPVVHEDGRVAVDVVADDQAVVGGAVIVDGDLEFRVGGPTVAGVLRECDGELAAGVVEGGRVVADVDAGDAQSGEVEGKRGRAVGVDGNGDPSEDLGGSERELDVVVADVGREVVFAGGRREAGLDGGRLGGGLRRGLGRAACGDRCQREEGEEGGVAGWWGHGVVASGEGEGGGLLGRGATYRVIWHPGRSPTVSGNRA